MLKKIKLDNYTTFINPTEIDFTASNYKFLERENVGNNKILKGCLLVGENASGKTNILKSITLLLDLLFINDEVDFMSKLCFYTPRPTYKMEYTFMEEGQEIIYLIELDKDGIVSEKLTFEHKIILERLGNTAKFNLNEEKIFNNLSNKLLFLRRIYFDTNFYGNEILNKWYSYMKNSVYINCYGRRIRTYADKDLLVHEYLKNNSVKEINDFLNKINYKQNIEYDDSGASNDNKVISFNKKGTNINIPESLESTGNRTLIELIPSFLYAVNNDCMLIIDEFSSGFHNELEECLIKYFFHYAKNSQMFFTTHSTNVLNNTIIRPDQIYSVYFDSRKGTLVERFSSSMPRESQNIEKMYLNGVFNGMPKYNKIFKD